MITWGYMKRAGLLILLLAVAFQVAAKPPQYSIKVGVDLVNIVFTVTDRGGRLVPALTASDFAIEEDGRRQDILHFSTEDDLPLTLAMVIDTSLSVEPVFDEEKRTAKAFLRSVLRSNDLALVIGFDRSVWLIQDFTESQRRLSNAIDDLELGTGTALYDAVFLAADEKLKREGGRKAIILISDGQDNGSKVELTRTLIAVHQSNTVIYSISNATEGRYRRFGGFRSDPGTMRRLSEETGGAFFSIERDGDFKAIFDQIARELRSQYTIAYKSSNTAQDGKYRRIKIVPKDPSLTVRARRGYYAAREVASR